MLTNLLLLPLLGLVQPIFAQPHGQHVKRVHHDLAKRAPGNVQVFEKRTDNARFTFYDVGLGACGETNVASDFIVALDSDMYGSGYPGPECFKKITISYGGKTTQATIMDECPGCPYGGLDMSRGLFDYFASEDLGVIYGSWSYDDGSSDTTTTTKATTTKATSTSTHTTSSTKKTTSTTPTSTWVATTTSSWSSSSVKTSSASSSPSSFSSSSTLSSSTLNTSSTVPSVTSTPGSIDYLNQAYIGIGDLIAAGAAN